MKFSWSKSKTVRQFWDWFAANSHRYSNLNETPDMESRLDEVGQQLHRVDERLAFEFMGDPAAECEFIISADGNAAAFPVVQSLVAAAPQMDGWKIIAFRQRGGAAFNIQIGDIELGPDQLWFLLEKDGDRIGLDLYFGGIELSDEVAYAALILLDGTLGEYDMETKVGWIERHQLQPESDMTQLRAFEHLPAAFDEFYRQMNS